MMALLHPLIGIPPHHSRLSSQSEIAGNPGISQTENRLSAAFCTSYRSQLATPIRATGVRMTTRRDSNWHVTFSILLDRAYSALANRLAESTPIDISIRVEKDGHIAHPGEPHYIRVHDDLISEIVSLEAKVILHFLYDFKKNLSRDFKMFAATHELRRNRIQKIFLRFPQLDQSTICEILSNKPWSIPKSTIYYKLRALEQSKHIHQSNKSPRFVTLSCSGIRAIEESNNDAMNILRGFLLEGEEKEERPTVVHKKEVEG
jgi:hypothetical protein